MGTTNQPHRIFLSYSRSNRLVCRTLFHMLRDAGHEVWWDERRLHGGDFIWDTIYAQLSQASSFVALLSEKALRSEYVALEVGFALDLIKKNHIGLFLPIKVRPCAAEAYSAARCPLPGAPPRKRPARVPLRTRADLAPRSGRGAWFPVPLVHDLDAHEHPSAR